MYYVFLYMLACQNVLHLLGSPAKTAACTRTCASTIFRAGCPLIGRLITPWAPPFLNCSKQRNRRS